MKEIISKYSTFGKYIISAGISYVVDYTLFMLFSKLFVNITVISYILLATIVARIVSSIVNFTINKNKVFNKFKDKNNENRTDLLLNYFLLVLVQMFMSAILVEALFTKTMINLGLVKFGIDCLIFLVNYFVQKKFIFNNKFICFKENLKKMFEYIKENKGICFILCISIILHIVAISILGYDYGLHSDDESYIKSGIYFRENFAITMHNNEISAQIMPGMTYLIAFMSYFFGKGKVLLISLKVLWMFMGVFSILGVYKIIRLFSNKIISCIASILLLAIDFIWMDNIILTETPFMLGFIYLIYATFMIARTNKSKYFYQIIFWFMWCVLLKANIALYPLLLVCYLLFKKYDMKLLIKQLFIAGGVLLLFFVPWIIRNYIFFDTFIPLTYGAGNPKLLGTYQGWNYPEDNQQEYDKYVDENASDEMKSYLNDVNDSKMYKKSYYLLEEDGLIAKYRMKKWWENDKISMIKSYLIYKPCIIIFNSFYWEPILGITKVMLLKVRIIDIILTLICGVAVLINKKYVKEVLFLGINYVAQVMVYSMTFAFDRYGQTIIFLRFIAIGMGLQVIYDFTKKYIVKRKKYKMLKEM